MSKIQIYLIYVAITAVLGAITFTIPDKAKGILKAIRGIASVLFVMIGITLLAFTAVLVLDKVAPNLGGGGNDNGQEQCVPDPWGVC